MERVVEIHVLKACTFSSDGLFLLKTKKNVDDQSEIKTYGCSFPGF